MLIPVEGNKGLFRDKNSSAILNCSNSDYERYLELKTTKIKESDRLNEINSKIDEIGQLKSDVNEIKDMMKVILSKLDSNS
jgi:5-enolpyruvylshikimate-3-phosphate synthase